MIDALAEAFAPAFMQRALLASLVAAVASAVIGTWVVVRGLAFIGDALAHGVIPGLALAVLVGFPPVLGAFAAALVMTGAVSLVGRRARLREDTGIGLLFVGMLALGVIIVSRSTSFTTDLTALLFGDVLGVTPADLVGQAVAAAVVVAGSLALYRPFLALSFNERKAASLGLHPAAAHLAMLGLVAASIVAAFQAVGTLLVFALLIGPPATATLLVRRVPMVMVTATALGAVAVVSGLTVSFHQGTAAGATIAAVSIALFFAALLAQEALDLVSRRRPPRVSAEGR